MAALNTFRTDGEDFGEQILSKVVKAGRRTYFLDAVSYTHLTLPTKA